MRLSFVSLLATDKVRLPALLYEPPRPTKKVVIWLHGMGDNGTFYKPQFINPLGEALTKRGIALLAMNNRGAHNSKNLKLTDASLPEEDRRYPGGTHYELITDCVHDINGAVEFLAQKKFSIFYLLGHSTGANKICAYHVRTTHNPFSKYVLAGPGDDIGTTFTRLGGQKFYAAINYAKQALKHNKPLNIMPRYSGMYPFSAQSALDILDPDGAYNTFPFFEASSRRLGKKPLFKEYKALDKPLLVIFGEQDEYTHTVGGSAQALELMRSATNPKVIAHSDFCLIAEADHGFWGAEETFAKNVSDWLSDE